MKFIYANVADRIDEEIDRAEKQGLMLEAIELAPIERAKLLADRGNVVASSFGGPLYYRGIQLRLAANALEGAEPAEPEQATEQDK